VSDNRSNDDASGVGGQIPVFNPRALAEVLIALLLIVLALAALFTTFTLTDVSMAPVLKPGQSILISRLSYQVQQPRRGELIVVTDPADASRVLVRRVIGLPGETVELRGEAGAARGAQVSINGRPLLEPYVTAQLQNAALITVSNRLQLGGGEFFVLPDNRAARGDSRDWGAVRAEQIVGRAWLTLAPVDALGFVDHDAFNARRTVNTPTRP
jgi:signal peptidase I